MAEHRRIQAPIPGHVAERIDHYAEPLGQTPAEYLSLIARKWFADGCPPVTPEEAALRKNTPSAQRAS